MAGAVSGWDVSEWAVALTAVIGSLAAVWKAAGVIRDIRDGVDFVQKMMKPNGGSSVIDRLTRLESNVSTLLLHDAERDQPGRRYVNEEGEDQ